jgi:hypothetical protein
LAALDIACISLLICLVVGDEVDLRIGLRRGAAPEQEAAALRGEDAKRLARYDL